MWQPFGMMSIQEFVLFGCFLGAATLLPRRTFPFKSALMLLHVVIDRDTQFE